MSAIDRLSSSKLTVYCAEHVTPVEAMVVQKLSALRSYPWLTMLMLTASRLGDGPLWYATGLYLIASGGTAGLVRTGATGLSILGVVLLFSLVKHRVGRPRPYQVWLDCPCLVAPPDKFSFPSGHTMTAFSVWSALRLLLPGSEVVFLPAAVLIGVSRIFLGLHYPTDVLVGSLLGSGIGTAMGFLFLHVLP